MGQIHDIKVKLDSFIDNINVKIAVAVENVEEELIEFNQEQLSRGLNKQGKAITPFYSAAYAKKKGFEIPDLKDTGAFQGAIFVSVDENNKSYFVGSEDDKTAGLIARYGADVLAVPVVRQPDAKALTTKELSKMVKNEVFNG